MAGRMVAMEHSPTLRFEVRDTDDNLPPQASAAIDALRLLYTMIGGGVDLKGWENCYETEGRIIFWIEVLEDVAGELKELLYD